MIELSKLIVLGLYLLLFAASCTGDQDPRSVRPRQLRDVPANRLAYHFQADVNAPPDTNDDAANKLGPVQDDFNNRRKDDALLRTVVSPDGKRALALYGTADEPSENFRIDLYSADGSFIRNLTPPDLAASFPEAVVWSTDSNFIAFIGRRNPTPKPSPTPLEEAPEVVPAGSPQPVATIAPNFAPVPLFNTEQIYLCNRDGFDLHPLTTREGLIYFYIAWAPDNHALVALACREAEWTARERDYKLPAGRPRLITLDGGERLLDDDLAEAAPVWSPDSSKVATAFDTDVGIYDAAGKSPTQARIKLRDLLIKASVAYEEKKAAPKPENTNSKAGPSPGAEPAEIPASFNSIVRVEWPSADQLYLQTAFVRMFPNDPVNNFPRWHLLVLSPQAALLTK
ncbi:MAG: hypothetical protein QOD75_808 [Blastocatellia bacterium]|nr:hypothetical protein [Blastocatellia bacterium]